MNLGDTPQTPVKGALPLCTPRFFGIMAIIRQAVIQASYDSLH